MPIGSVEERAGRTDFDAVAALGTIEPPAVSSNNRAGAAIARFDGLLAHPFVADARAALAEDATLRIVGDHRRKIFFRVVVFLFGEALFQIAPIEGLLLQLAFAAAIANRAIERMVREQKLEHGPLGLLNLFALCLYELAVGAYDGTGNL